MMIYFKGKELRFWTWDAEYLVLKDVVIKNISHTLLFKKKDAFQERMYNTIGGVWEPYIESRFGSPLWQLMESTTEETNLDMLLRPTDDDGEIAFMLGQNHIPIFHVARWSKADVEYVLEISNVFIGSHLASIERVDTVLEYLLDGRLNKW